MGYDTMVVGHLRRLMQLQRMIVGGSVKGYDEYCLRPEPSLRTAAPGPVDRTPRHGITLSMPVLADRSPGEAGDLLGRVGGVTPARTLPLLRKQWPELAPDAHEAWRERSRSWLRRPA